MTESVLRFDRVFDGELFHSDVTVTVADGYVTSVASGEAAAAPTPSGSDLMAVPGFLDLQINGAGGLLFTGEPTVPTLVRMAQALAEMGTTNFLPTFITGSAQRMRRAQQAVAEHRKRAGSEVLGIHFEGPLLSPQQIGVHSERYLRRDVNWDEVLPPDGVRLVTLAPEVAPPGEIAALRKRGVLVSMGHTNATYEEARDAIAEGVTMVTHMFNATGEFRGRQPGAIGACLESGRVRAGMIVDGVHCHPSVVAATMQVKGPGGVFLVSDAMPPVGSDLLQFDLDGERIVVRDGACWRDRDGVLAGGYSCIADAVRRCVQSLGTPLAEALRMGSRYPAEALQLGHELGRIKAGYRACFTLLDEQLQVRAVVRDGVLMRVPRNTRPEGVHDADRPELV